LTNRALKTCPKCRNKSGNDWSHCGDSCPMPMSPHYKPPMITIIVMTETPTENFTDEIEVCCQASLPCRRCGIG
jgi:hypothetical protein